MKLFCRKLVYLHIKLSTRVHVLSSVIVANHFIKKNYNFFFSTKTAKIIHMYLCNDKDISYTIKTSI